MIITRIHNLDGGWDDVHGQDKVEEVMNMNNEQLNIYQTYLEVDMVMNMNKEQLNMYKT